MQGSSQHVYEAYVEHRETGGVGHANRTRLAQEVFEFHAKGFAFDPKRSGAEWWVQIRDTWIENAKICKDLHCYNLLSSLVDFMWNPSGTPNTRQHIFSGL